MKKFFNISADRLSFFRCTFGPGSAPIFSLPKSRQEILDRLDWVAGMFKEDGSYNVNNKGLEEYAVCLHEDGFKDEALKIFDLIIDPRSSVLSVKKYTPGDAYQAPEGFAREPGKLGFEGLYRYGLLAFRKGRLDVAYSLLAELVDRIPTECGPVRLQDVRVDAIKIMLEISPSQKLKDELKRAQEYQY